MLPSPDRRIRKPSSAQLTAASTSTPSPRTPSSVVVVDDAITDTMSPFVRHSSPSLLSLVLLPDGPSGTCCCCRLNLRLEKSAASSEVTMLFRLLLLLPELEPEVDVVIAEVREGVGLEAGDFPCNRVECSSAEAVRRYATARRTMEILSICCID